MGRRRAQVHSTKTLKAFRKLRGFSQEGLSRQVDVSHALIAHIETGRKQPSFEVAERIAAVLEIDIEALFRITPPLGSDESEAA